MNFKQRFSDYISMDHNKYRFVSIVAFVLIITALAWQSDDAYHAYVMAKHLVEGNGFVYNIGERASASSCPLFTLVIALGYFIIRNMFLVSLLICVIFSTIAYATVVNCFCTTRRQIILSFLLFIGSVSFISYTTSGLENCLLFMLSALFLKMYYKTDAYDAKKLFIMGLIVALTAMTRMDAAVLLAPAVLYVYIAKRDRISFLKAVPIGILSLSPFILWELFSLFYYGFLVPNTAFVKLGTDIPLSQYIFRGLQYLGITTFCDLPVILIPVFAILLSLFVREAKYLFVSLGIVLYMAYVIYIGGDFMLGRHFTVIYLMSVIMILDTIENASVNDIKKRRYENNYILAIVTALILTVTTKPITNQFLYGNNFGTNIADERAGYFRYTSLFNNAVSYFKTGDMCIRDAWNEAGIEELRGMNISSGILRMVPGITIYYNSDMYLNDQYALGDPFLSKLPAVREDNWRIGHMWREVPDGYADSVMFGGNRIENESLKEYYEVIKLITGGKLFDGERIRAIIDINTGKYDHLIEEYRATLDENNRLKQK
ncbi:MAG: glycosyltransferase family 39 protein [Lachnospiraceae bacterium]|nr:glycosyltransferase family 39 protein [Lachnospiraceae bacterium]